MLWAVLGFMSGLICMENLKDNWWISAVTLFVLLIKIVQEKMEFRLLFLFLCLFLLGSCIFTWQIRNAAPVLEGQVGQNVVASGIVKESKAGQAYLWLKVSELNGFPLESAVQLYVTIPKTADKATESTQKAGEIEICYAPGSKLTVLGELAMPQGQRNPGGFDEQQWLRSKKVQYKLHTQEILLAEPPKGIWQIGLQVRCYMERTAAAYLADHEAATAMALLLGEKQQLPPAFYRLTQRMGIAHIFAVSGLHVGYVGVLFLFFFQLGGWQRSWFSFVLLLIGLLFYCFLTGFPPSAVRAAAMIILAALAIRLNRPPISLDFLAAAALLILFDNPFLLWTAGFQLSFGVTLALLLFVRPLQQALHWLKRPWIISSVAVAMAAYLGSLPLSAWHFYGVSLYAPFFNLLLVPLVSILVPLMLIGFLLTVIFPLGGALFFFPVQLLLRLLLWSTASLGQWIGSGQWFVGRPPIFAMVLYLCFCVALWHLLQRIENNNKIERYFVVSLLFLSILFALPKPPATDELLYLDTGQGSCAILRTKAGETIIFDGGAQQRELASCLAWYGIHQIKAIILSHGDTDHIRGVEQVLESIPVTYLLMERNQLQRDTMVPVVTLAGQQGTEIKAIDDGAALRLKQGIIELQVYQDDQDNNNSIELTALLYNSYGAVAFPGDLSVQGIEKYIREKQQISIWTVPHHGSRNSANQEIYYQLKEKGVQLAVISAGKENGYGHPHREVLQFLRQAQIPWQRTDEKGAILLKLGA